MRQAILIIILGFIFLMIIDTQDELQQMDYQIQGINQKLNIIEENLLSLDEKIASQTLTHMSKYYDVSNKQLEKQNFTIYNVPSIDTSFKAYMDYRTITDETSAQWALQQQAYTDEYGLRKIDNCYLVAMGSFYTTQIGEIFTITLDNNNSFKVMIGDLKQDCHTNSTNQYSEITYGDFTGGNVIEFIIDEQVVDDMVLIKGDVSHYEQFNGNIIKIVKEN